MEVKALSFVKSQNSLSIWVLGSLHYTIHTELAFLSESKNRLGLSGTLLR